ncbi:prepilin peptidase [Glycomyces arizonensis]|uniref:prepilin peptidase n=1 Tax=Glycomyces arizonensis TaxID=256035 RepID=UPI0012EBE3ED|nr:prepilin peptidase [Glycomyces arizonensis]
MVVLAVGLVGGVAGAALGRWAFALEPSDALADWRGSSRAARVRVMVVLAAVSAIAAAVSVLLIAAWEIGVGVWAFAVASPGLAVIDLAARRLPFAVSGAIALVAVAGLAFTPSRLWTGLFTAAVVAGLLAVLSLATGSGAGLGDVALAGVAALTLAWAGWVPVVVCFVVAMLASALVGIAVRMRWGARALVPFGPFLVIGWWIALTISIVD